MNRRSKSDWQALFIEQKQSSLIATAFCLERDLNLQYFSLLALDQKIQSDINKYVDSSSQLLISDSKKDLSMWMAAFEIIQDDVFSKNDQEQFKIIFGNETFDKLIGFLSNFSKDELENAVHEKIEISRNELESLIPHSF